MSMAAAAPIPASRLDALHGAPDLLHILDVPTVRGQLCDYIDGADTSSLLATCWRLWHAVISREESLLRRVVRFSRAGFGASRMAAWQHAWPASAECDISGSLASAHALMQLHARPQSSAAAEEYASGPHGEIDRDVTRTFPSHPVFRVPDSLAEVAITPKPAQLMAFTRSSGCGMLRAILHAYAVARPDVGYCQGMNYVAAAAIVMCKGCQHPGSSPAVRLPRARGPSLALETARSAGVSPTSSPVGAPAPRAGMVTVTAADVPRGHGISSAGRADDITHAVVSLLVGLTDAAGLRDVWRRGLPRVGALAYQLSAMLRIHTPKLHEHLARIGFHMEVLAAQWLLTLLASALPICTLARVWDVFAMDGWKMLFRTVVAILRALEPRALGMDVGDMSCLFRAWKAAIGHAECGPNAPTARALVAEYNELDIIFTPDALLEAAMRIKITRRMLAEAEEAHALHVLKQKVVAHIAAHTDTDGGAAPGTARRNSTISSTELLGRSPRDTPRTRQAQELPLMPPAAFVLRVSPFAVLPSVQAQRGYHQRVKRGGLQTAAAATALRHASAAAPPPQPNPQFFILSPIRPLRPRPTAASSVLRTPAPVTQRQPSAPPALPVYEGVQGWLKYMETHNSMHASDTGTRMASCHLVQLLNDPGFHAAVAGDMARLFRSHTAAIRARTESIVTETSPTSSAPLSTSASSAPTRGGPMGSGRPSFFGVPPVDDPPSPPPSEEKAEPMPHVPMLDVSRIHAPAAAGETTPDTAGRRTLRSMPSFIDSPGAIERVGRRLGLAVDDIRAQSNDTRAGVVGAARPGFLTRVRRTDSAATPLPAAPTHPTTSTPAGVRDGPHRVLPPSRETRTASVTLAAPPPLVRGGVGNGNDYRLDVGSAFATALSALAADFYAVEVALRNDGVALNDKITSVRTQLRTTRAKLDAAQSQVKLSEELVVQLLRAKRSASRTLHDIMTQPTQQHARHAQAVKRFSALLSGLDQQLKEAGVQWRAAVWSSTLIETRADEMRHVTDALMAQLIAMSNQAEGDKAFLFRRLWFALSIVWQHAAGRRHARPGASSTTPVVAAPTVIAARGGS